MIAFLIVLVLLVILLQYFDRRIGLEGLEAELAFSEILVEPGAEFQLNLTLTNRRRTFLPFLRLEVRLPEQMCADVSPDHVRKSLNGGSVVTRTAWLAPHQKLELSVPVSVTCRGRCVLTGLTVWGGDFLGISEQRHDFSSFLEVVAMPAPADEPSLDNLTGGWPGDISVNRFLFEDPVLTVGYRDYTGREPMKTISWTQTARTGNLMVKQYDHTLETSVTVVLNVAGGTIGEQEACLSLARSVCRKLEDTGIRYSFQTNAVPAGGLSSWRSVAEGLGRRHFLHIMEGLGRAVADRAICSCEALLEATARGGDTTQALVFLTPASEPETVVLARRRGNLAGIKVWTFTGAEAESC